MGMGISDTSANGQDARLKVRSSAPQSKQASRGFLENFRILPESRFRKSSSGLMVATIREGAGKPFTAGMKIKVQYSGWLEDGTRFDSSLDKGRPFEFTLGSGRVIKGWEEGLAGIRPGERRQIIIPPELGYGNRQVGDIRPGSTLIFNVEAVAVNEPAANPKGNMTVVA